MDILHHTPGSVHNGCIFEGDFFFHEVVLIIDDSILNPRNLIIYYLAGNNMIDTGAHLH
jgi:hypothetical protein